MKKQKSKKESFALQSQEIASTTKFFHWIIAFLVMMLLIVGFSFSWEQESPVKTILYSIHKSVGILVFILMIGRFFYRLKYPFPALPKATSLFRKILARSIEGFLYILLFIQPLIGWAMNSAAGYTVSFFNLFKLPSLCGKSLSYAIFFQEVHSIIGFLLVFLIGLHVMGALHHHFICKDSVLRRMLPKISSHF